MDLVYQDKFEVTPLYTDCFGRLKPSAILYIAQEIAGVHCFSLGVDWDTLQKKNLFWALLRTHVQISKLPRLGQCLNIETWPMPQTRTAYPRCTVGYDEAGNECFRIISLWVMMDTQSRSMVLPANCQVQVDGTVRGNEPPLPKGLPVKPGTHTRCRTVGFAELDRNLHMNNTRYLDWAMDLTDSVYHKAHDVQAFTVCYFSEAREGQEITLSHSLENGILNVNGHRQRTDVSDQTERVFAVQMQFS